jgi:hypothetical protein
MATKRQTLLEESTGRRMVARSFELEAELDQRVMEAARADDRSFSAQVRYFLREALAEREERLAT